MIAIMQPYYFPYLGHFALMSIVRRWVVFDTSQYKPKSWMNRNKIAKDRTNSRYISVPLIKSSINIPIRDAIISDPSATMKSHLGMLELYRYTAPYYRDVRSLFESVYSGSSSRLLVDLNTSCLMVISKYLGLGIEFLAASSLCLDFDNKPLPGEWAGLICKSLGETRYVNPISGRHLFDRNFYQSLDISLSFLDFKHPQLTQGDFKISEPLSILHYLMFYSPSSIRELLASHSCLLEA